ncbi:hypothetical protein BFJ68_g1125 [Fusarium oxysporum]|uniref:Uncharacterized protein n=2 Tax=Fusarium oxysporum TaxID=5507 RepID=A0A420S443_FUSOX|nr:hypothetical protein BFJ67_g3267 [Fusarium oxysporum f. sp. cepae]RKK58466.1 hypothetical protein BFJ66_g2769 [Fusarium oxysporum f. sp. cepae]RKK97933.1 hypothetical protein BFJ71_g6991 [Fusarium oxysporum]RKL23969.1 hypothetical protein BFJ68_g1125 [Fusarium oxysporum]
MESSTRNMSIGTKTEISASNFEADVESVRTEPSFRIYRLIDSARLGLTVLGLAAALTILGVSADALAVFHATYVPEDWLLQLWPANFDMRPTVALVVGSALVIGANLVSLIAGKLPTTRRNAAVKAAITFVPPAIALVAAIIAMSFFYGVNASTTNDSLQSWTCRWKDVTMNVQPHFGTLCKQSRAGVALSVMLVPVEAIILGLAAYQFTLEKRFDLGARGPSRKAGSPALS